LEKQEAKLILNLETWPPHDVLEEILEDEVFNLRDYFLRNPVVPVLYKSRIRKLKKLQEILETFLKKTETTFELAEIQDSKSNDLREILRFLESHLSRVRQQIAQSLNPVHLAQLAENMIKIQLKFEELFKTYCYAENIKPAQEEVKAAQHINTGLGLKFIETQNQKDLTSLLEKELKRIVGRNWNSTI